MMIERQLTKGRPPAQPVVMQVYERGMMILGFIVMAFLVPASCYLTSDYSWSAAILMGALGGLCCGYVWGFRAMNLFAAVAVGGSCALFSYVVFGPLLALIH